VPTRSFLQTTIGWFLEEPKLAMLQTPHHFYSPDPFERNLGTFKNVPNEGELFYGLLQPANDVWNAVFFCGSCAVLRRTALEEVGGIAVETVTEDAHTALKMHRRGWSTAYLKLTQAAGLATESLSAHVGQRIRWARGMVQIFRIDNPLFGKGLKWQQRLCYTASMLHFLGGIPRIIFLVSPLFYLLFDRHIFNSLPVVALAYGLPHLAHLTLTNSRVQGGVRHSFWSEVYETCLSYYIALPTTVALINPKLGKFNVTAKGGVVQDAFFESKIARPYLVLLALNILGAATGLWKITHGSTEIDVVAINIAWTVYNALILTATLAVAWESRQLREAPRVTVKMPAMLRLATGATLRAATLDLSRLGGAISLPSAREIPAGQRVWLSLFWGGEEVPLPAEVVSTSGKTVRLRFETLSIDEETALTQAIFSRANAWTQWTQGRPTDRPLVSFVTILSLASRGTWQIAKSFLPRPSRGPKPVVAGGAS
jgi:cellulose synthase (UDP-forming)